MLQRSFSLREKILLLILTLIVIGVGYFLLIWQPLHGRIDEAQTRQADAETAFISEQARLADMERMRNEIEEVKTLEQSENTAAIPPYDNAKRVMQLLNGVLNASKHYRIDFSNIEIGGNLVRRTLQMSFECSAYADAKQILRALYDAPYRCRIGNISVHADGEGFIQTGAVAVNVEISFFEYLNNEQLSAYESGELLDQ